MASGILNLALRVLRELLQVLHRTGIGVVVDKVGGEFLVGADRVVDDRVEELLVGGVVVCEGMKNILVGGVVVGDGMENLLVGGGWVVVELLLLGEVVSEEKMLRNHSSSSDGSWVDLQVRGRGSQRIMLDFILIFI